MRCMAFVACILHPASSFLALADRAALISLCIIVMRAPLAEVDIDCALAIIWSQLMAADVSVDDIGVAVLVDGPVIEPCAKAGPTRQNASATALKGI